MNAQQKLAEFGLTVELAREWIMSNLDNPSLVFETALQYGIDSSMLAEIVEPVFPGVRAVDVEAFFSSHGLQGAYLSAGYEDEDFVWSDAELQLLNATVTENYNEGLLSTDYLRSQILVETAYDDYMAFFSPSLYDGNGDGWLVTTEFALAPSNGVAASAESIESLYFGTLIKVLNSVDAQEITLLEELAYNPYISESEVIDMVLSVFEDEANLPLFTEAEISQGLVYATGLLIEEMAAYGGGGISSDVLWLI